MESQDLQSLYQYRFRDVTIDQRRRIWDRICGYFQRQGYVRPDDSVLELGAGYGEFINSVTAKTKAAIDLNEDSRRYLGPDVEFLLGDARRMRDLVAADSFDLCFTSNFLEHLQNKADLFDVIEQVRSLLRNGGRFLIMGPNIKFVGGAYWDFIDHHLPLTETSVCEALAISGFEIQLVEDRFLPYSMKQKLPTHPFLVDCYLRFRPAWRILGKQFLIVAAKV